MARCADSCPREFTARQMQGKVHPVPQPSTAKASFTPTFLIVGGEINRKDQGKQTGTTVLDKGEIT
jgi:hypothetical protein